MTDRRNQISLLGDPIPETDTRGGRAAALLVNPYVIASGLYVGFSMAAAALTQQNVMAAGFGALKDSGLLVGLYRAVEFCDVFMALGARRPPKDLVIDTKPNQAEPPDFEKWGLFSLDMKRRTGGLGITVFLGLVLNAATQFSPAPWSECALEGAYALTFPFLAYRRWSKVVNGEWAIGKKGPPKKRVPFKLPAIVFGRRLAPTTGVA